MELLDTKKNELINFIADLDEQNALSIIDTFLKDGMDPLQILKDCQEGMRQVGERYEEEEYFISGLIMAGEIFRQAMDILQPVVRENMSGEASGLILLGTVQGDIHNLGKDMVGDLLKCHGFEVHDVGVDVSPRTFLDEAENLKPDIIGMSILMTNALDYTRESIHLIRHASIPEITKTPVIIGGSLTDDDVSKYVKADYWVNDAMEGVRVCLNLMDGT